MSNSIVKVVEEKVDNSLLVVIGEDGVITPDQASVEEYLQSCAEGADLQIMQVNKSDGRTVDVTVDKVMYMPNHVDEDGVAPYLITDEMDDLSRNLLSFRMDHDYTNLTSPIPHEEDEEEEEEEDELAQTLSMFEGTSPKPVSSKVRLKTVLKPSLVGKDPRGQKLALKEPVRTAPYETDADYTLDEEEEEEEEEEDEVDEEYEEQDDADDSDFEMDSTLRSIGSKRVSRPHKSGEKESRKRIKQTKVAKAPQTFNQPLRFDSEMFKSPKQEPTPEPRKLSLKKEKKAVKPAPFDNCLLFSTPDLIRRVGGKQEASTSFAGKSPQTPTSPTKLTEKRLSTDVKLTDKVRRSSQSSDSSKERRLSSDPKTKRLSIDSKHDRRQSADKTMDVRKSESTGGEFPASLPAVAVPQVESDLLATNVQPGINLEPDALDLDQSILDNINSDLISEDILYQVAQSLVDNAELQSAINKSLNDGNLDLDTPIQGITDTNLVLDSNQGIHETEPQHQTEVKGTQIVKPDGRVVVLPPIERPTTRSRNKRKDDTISTSPQPPKITPKLEPQLPEETANSGSEVEEEQSDDDPDKLWCICNQPHNNRFMICCDTCEEWYHGKCVNVTKAMGQLMEQEGREWICLYCKDSSLTRPMAAARRVRKASRASSGSVGSHSKSFGETDESSSSSVPKCIVCGKPSRNSSIYCSDACILKHAQGVEKVVVFERSSGRILSGNNAPTAANLEQWLKDHPGFEVVRSTTNKPVKTVNKQYTQSRLHILKNAKNEGASLVVQKKGVNVGVLRHSPHRTLQQFKLGTKTNPKSVNYKIISKNTPNQPKIKLIQPQPVQPSIQTTNVKSKVAPTQKVIKDKTPLPQKTPKSRQAEDAAPQPKQENIRDNVRKTLFEQLNNRLKLVDDFKLTKEEVTKISAEIESQLYKCFGDTGQKYRIKYRSLMFNIKDIKNQTLWRRICERTINPYQLVRLSPDDMASQELASWRERETKHQLDMITKAELEELGRQKQYVFKTHKGEQELEENRPSDGVDNMEVITALKADSTSMESTDSKKDHKNRDKKKHKDDKRDRSNKDRDRTSRDKDRSSSKDKEHRRRSRSRDRSSRHGRKRSHSREKERHRKHRKDETGSTEKLDKKSKEILEQLVDNKIVPPLEDRLWKHVQQEDITSAPNVDSDSDHEPTSTVTIPTPPRTTEDSFSQSSQQSPPAEPTQTIEDKTEKTELSKVSKRIKHVPEISSKLEEGQRIVAPSTEYVWKGTINMVDVAQISITAHQVSGDCSGLSEELPPCLDVVGRISPDTVWDYIGKMKCSNSKAITLLRLTATNVEEKMPYIALYSYLSSRNRLGVVKSGNKAVKDFYILPLASQKPIPPALLPLNGPGFEDPRPAILLGIIVRDKRKRPTYESAGSSAKRHKTSDHSRSYTPPPVSAKKTPYLPTPILDNKNKVDDMDEPYSPEDSDPDTSISLSTKSPAFTATVATVKSTFLDSTLATQTFEPFANKFESIPGLEHASSEEIQRKMQELDQRIAMEQAEIVNMSQNIASTASADLGTTALASIALPNNLQQILDSIKGIGAASTNTTTNQDTILSTGTTKIPSTNNTELTMPLLLPKIGRIPPTIPLNLPRPRKTPTNSPKTIEQDRTVKTTEKSSVLSTLSEEDLIRKAAEMLGESTGKDSPKLVGKSKVNSPVGVPPPPPQIVEKQQTKPTLTDLPSIPGLD